MKKRLLEAQRTSGLENSKNTFALELAYVTEYFGDDTEEDAKKVLDLYLRGAKSVMLAALYAQRTTKHSSMLWDILIKHCLESKEATEENASEEVKGEGILFGSLLESAALCGADLAVLVTRIPEGMQIEGLRPRLVAAVGDYRLKLQMHEAAAEVGVAEKVDLLRQVGHRSRRGMRRHAGSGVVSEEEEFQKDCSVVDEVGKSKEPMKRRPRERPNRYRLGVQLPIR